MDLHSVEEYLWNDDIGEIEATQNYVIPTEIKNKGVYDNSIERLLLALPPSDLRAAYEMDTYIRFICRTDRAFRRYYYFAWLINVKVEQAGVGREFFFSILKTRTMEDVRRYSDATLYNDFFIVINRRIRTNPQDIIPTAQSTLEGILNGTSLLFHSRGRNDLFFEAYPYSLYQERLVEDPFLDIHFMPHGRWFKTNF